MPHIKRSSESQRLPHLNLTDINTNGCISLFTRHLRIAMNTLFILILLAVVVDVRYISSWDFSLHFSNPETYSVKCLNNVNLSL